MTSRSRSGMTMMLAVTLLVMVAAALVALTQLVRDDAGRTLDERRGAQLRALLLAGQIYAAAELTAGRECRNANVPLPPELGEASLVVDSEPSADESSVAVIARLNGTTMTACFRLAPEDGGAWVVRDASLNSD